MIGAIWYGILVGLILSISAGPAMFALIQAGIREGFRRAMMMEVGILLSDAFCIAVAMFSLTGFLTNPAADNYIFAVGGVVLALTGLRYFFGKSRNLQRARDFMRGKKSDYSALFIKGFLYNLMNPGVIIFWIGAVTLASTNYRGSRPIMIAHFAAALLVVFLFDIVKVYFAHRLKKFITPRVLVISNKILGLIFMGFGVALFLKGVLF